MTTRYVQRDVEVTEDNIAEVVRFDYELEQMFVEWMDEVYPLVTIGYRSLLPSRCLKGADPVAYRADFNNWLDSEGWDEVDDHHHFW